MNLKSAIPTVSGLLKVLVALAVINTVAKRVPMVGKITSGF
jgi:hypothetical protein